MLLPGGGQVELAGVPWAWAYPLSSPHGPDGYLIVGAAGPLAESERFLLQVLAQQAAGRAGQCASAPPGT